MTRAQIDELDIADAHAALRAGVITDDDIDYLRRGPWCDRERADRRERDRREADRREADRVGSGPDRRQGDRRGRITGEEYP